MWDAGRVNCCKYGRFWIIYDDLGRRRVFFQVSKTIRSSIHFTVQWFG